MKIRKNGEDYIIDKPFQPLDWQLKAFENRSPILLLTQTDGDSAGGGKSHLCAEKIHGFCKKFEGAMTLALRKTRESTTNSIVLLLERTVMSGNTGVRHLPSKRRFEYPNGSILAYGGMKDDDQREQIRSIGQAGGVDFIWMEEANQFSREDFDELKGRLRGRAADWRQIILSCNPDSDLHWIYRDLILDGQATVMTCGAEDNPYNPPDYVETLKTMSGVLGMRLRDGKWTRAMGIVYEDFNPLVHIIDVIGIEPKRIFSSVDWGFTNPGCIHTWFTDGDDRIYLVGEIYFTRRTIDWWVEKAKGIQSLYPEHEAFVCDPSEPGMIQKFNDSGLNAIPANNDVSSGIQEVINRLALAEDGKPRIFFHRDCPKEIDETLLTSNGKKERPLGIFDEFSLYSWQKSRDQIVIKEKPEAKHDHAMDSMRYACMYMRQPAIPELYTSSRSWSTDDLMNQLGIR